MSRVILLEEQCCTKDEGRPLGIGLQDLTSRGRRRDVLSESPVSEIGPLVSMRGMWKRGYGSAVEAPPNERGGNR